MVWEEAAERIDQSLKKKKMLEKPRHTSFGLMHPIQTAPKGHSCPPWALLKVVGASHPNDSPPEQARPLTAPTTLKLLYLPPEWKKEEKKIKTKVNIVSLGHQNNK